MLSLLGRSGARVIGQLTNLKVTCSAFADIRCIGISYSILKQIPDCKEALSSLHFWGGSIDAGSWLALPQV